MTATVAPTAHPPEAKGAQPGKAAAPASPDAALFAIMVREGEVAAEPTLAPARPAQIKAAPGAGKASVAKPAAEPVTAQPDKDAQTLEPGAESAAESLAASAQLMAPAPAFDTLEPTAAAPEILDAAPTEPHAPTFELAQPEAGEAAPELKLSLAEAAAASAAKPSALSASPVAGAAEASVAQAPADQRIAQPVAAEAPQPPLSARAEAQTMAPAAPLVAAAAELAPAARPLQPASFRPAVSAKGPGAQLQSSAQDGLFASAAAISPETARAMSAAASGETAFAADDEGAELVPPTFDLASDVDAAPADAGPDASPMAQSSTASGQATAQPGLGSLMSNAATIPALAAEIARKLEAKASRFEVQLDPHGLGQVMVQVKIDASGRLSAALSFENAAAAAQLHARAGELRAQLEQAGFDLSRGGLSFDTAGQGFEGGPGSGFGQAQDGSAAFRGRAFGRTRQTLDLADVAAAQRTAASGVDLRI